MEFGSRLKFSSEKTKDHESKSHIRTFLAGTALFAVITPAIAYGVNKYDQKIEQENRFNGKKFEQTEQLHPWVEASHAVILPDTTKPEDAVNIEELSVQEPDMNVAEVQVTPVPVAVEVVEKPAPTKPIAPKINAPLPATFKWENGKRVCEKKNDHPTKSKVNNKGKIHMDMECCLDPDEFPNPNCSYDPVKYGKYLNPAHQAKLKSKK